jgi:uncharacterized protein YdeI (YjbR/CyaY-like superfamily)
MATKNPKIDAYILKSADFAKPILIHLRELVHKACPDVVETIKWGMPFFDYKGPLCNMASFKQHAVFGLWKAKLLKDPKNYLQERSSEGGSAMGHLGRLTSIKDLPPDRAMLDFIKQAMKLNEAGVKVELKPKVEKKELVVPAYFSNALKKNKKALSTFNAFSYSHKKEYVEWVTEAKTDATRDKRMDTAIEWMAEGKGRNWKYQKK